MQEIINIYRSATITYTSTPPLKWHLDKNYSSVVPVHTVKAYGAMEI
jgi:hypothetical protein